MALPTPPDRLTKDEARNILRDAASNGGRLEHSAHGYGQGDLRYVTPHDAARVLHIGEQTSDPVFDNERRSWKVCVEADLLDYRLRVIAAIDEQHPRNQVVVTVVTVIVPN